MTDDVKAEDLPEAAPTEKAIVPTTGDIETLAQLAATERGVIISAARAKILQTLRRDAIRLTSPSDHVLFRAPTGQVTSFLQDAGAQRVRDLFGIEIYDVSKPEKQQGSEPGTFHYLISGSGYCKITDQRITDVEGGRSSDEDFCKGKKGVELELAVRKAARANLDGNITRELAGLKSIPIEELAAAWTGTAKSTDRCHRGRGFGTKAERSGAPAQTGTEAPLCEICGAEAIVIKAGTTREGKKYDAFWACPDKDRKHPTQKWGISLADWDRLRPAPREPGDDDA